MILRKSESISMDVITKVVKKLAYTIHPSYSGGQVETFFLTLPYNMQPMIWKFGLTMHQTDPHFKVLTHENCEYRTGQKKNLPQLLRF